MKVLAVATLVCACLLPAYGQVPVTTWRNNNNRDGQNLNETILTPGNVNVATFGKLFSLPVDGYVYAQPLYVPNVTIPGRGVHNVIYVATEHDSVYAFDADDNKGTNANPLWHVRFINPAKGITTLSNTDTNCTEDIVPEVGITSTPVIDVNNGMMYVLVRTKESGTFVQRLQKINISNGSQLPGYGAYIHARVKGTGLGSKGGWVAFDPLIENQRAGLLLQNGNIYIGWASHCDAGDWHGWVISYDETTLQQTGVWNSSPNGGKGSIWAGGAGIAADSNSNLFFATGNGSYDGKTAFGDSIVKLTPTSGIGLTVTDWFTPYDQATFSTDDTDVGSGGVVLLPDQSAPHTHLLLQVGKSGSLYLIDRDNMGQFNPNNNSQIVQELDGVVGDVRGAPAWWNNNIYVGSAYKPVMQLIFDPATETISSTVASHSRYFGYPGPSPAISANGTTNAIVWALDNRAFASNGSSVLYAYDATNLSHELYDTNQNLTRDAPGGAVKFTVPTIANGKVYVPTSNQVSVYGLLPAK